MERLKMRDRDVEMSIADGTDKQTLEGTDLEKIKIIEEQKKIVKCQHQNIQDQEKNISAQVKNIKELKNYIKNHETAFEAYKNNIHNLDKTIEGLSKESKKSTDNREEVYDKIYFYIVDEDDKKIVLDSIDNKNIEKKIKQLKELKKDLLPTINKEKENIDYLKQQVQQQEENIRQQVKNAENQKGEIDCQIKSIEKQKDVLLQSSFYKKVINWPIRRLFCAISFLFGYHMMYFFFLKKIEDKENHALITVGVAMGVVGLILMAWSNMLLKSGTCEKDKALAFLDLNYTFQCNYEDVKERMESIFLLGFVSVVSDFLFLFTGFFLERVPKKIRMSGLKCLYIFTALEVFAFAVPLLKIYTEMADVKTKDTDYIEVKKIMLYSLTQTYSSDNTTNSNTMSGRWNRYFIQYDCCAVNQVIGTTNDFDTTPWCTTSGSCQQANSQIPKTCCKAVTEDDYQNAHDSCHSVVQIGSFKESCFTKFMSLGDKTIETYQIHVLYTLLFTLGIMKLIAFILAGGNCMMMSPCFEKVKNWWIKKSKSKKCTINEKSGLKNKAYMHDKCNF